MAVYTNLAVDCGDNESVANDLLGIYQTLTINTAEFGATKCDVEHIRPNRHWRQPNKFSHDAGTWHTLCVTPTGVGNGRPLPDSLIAELRPQLYEPLKHVDRFRTAWFGWEAQDSLGEIDWLDILDKMNRTGVAPEMPGLILASNLVLNDKAKSRLTIFSPGYFWYETI